MHTQHPEPTLVQIAREPWLPSTTRRTLNGVPVLTRCERYGNVPPGGMWKEGQRGGEADPAAVREKALSRQDTKSGVASLRFVGRDCRETAALI